MTGQDFSKNTFNETVEDIVSFLSSQSQQEEGTVVISMPLEQLTEEGRERIRYINAVLSADKLPEILIEEEKVSFPWFPYTEESQRFEAYAGYTCRLWKTLK